MTGQDQRGEPEMTQESLDRNEIARHDGNIFLDKNDDDWEWRRKLRANPATAKLYRLGVGLLGLIIVAGGLALVPLPGPGWLIVFAGLAVWASEFEWAQALLDWVRDKVRAWNVWIKGQPLWVQALAALVTLAAVLTFFWVLFRLSGVPSFLPDAAEDWLHTFAGL